MRIIGSRTRNNSKKDRPHRPDGETKEIIDLTPLVLSLIPNLQLLKLLA